MEYIQVGQKVKKLRKEEGITAEALAEICDVTTATIRHIEAGRRGMSLEFLIRLCNTLKVTSDYLLNEEFTFERHPDKHDIYNLLDTLTPKQLELLDQMITAILKYDD